MADDWREHDGAGWKLALPCGLVGGPVKDLTNPELTTAAVFRGWVSENALYVAVASRPREHSSLRDESRKLSRHFSAGPSDGDLIELPGSHRGARRVEGLMDIEEGYGEAPAWTERLTCVVAGRGKHEVVVVTIRRHPQADLGEVVDRIVASFRLVAGDDPPDIVA